MPQLHQKVSNYPPKGAHPQAACGMTMSLEHCQACLDPSQQQSNTTTEAHGGSAVSCCATPKQQRLGQPHNFQQKALDALPATTSPHLQLFVWPGLHKFGNLPNRLRGTVSNGAGLCASSGTLEVDSGAPLTNPPGAKLARLA